MNAPFLSFQGTGNENSPIFVDPISSSGSTNRPKRPAAELATPRIKKIAESEAPWTRRFNRLSRTRRKRKLMIEHQATPSAFPEEIEDSSPELRRYPPTKHPRIGTPPLVRFDPASSENSKDSDFSYEVQHQETFGEREDPLDESSSSESFLSPYTPPDPVIPSPQRMSPKSFQRQLVALGQKLQTISAEVFSLSRHLPRLR